MEKVRKLVNLVLRKSFVTQKIFGNITSGGRETTNVDCRFWSFLAVESTFIFVKKLFICRSKFISTEL